MEYDRTLRFLIPPFVFFASLYLGAVLDPNICLQNFFKDINSHVGIAKILGIVASGGIAVVALGFLISMVSIILLRLVFIFVGQDYEAHVSNNSLTKIWKKIDPTATTETDKKQMLYLVATYDHHILPHTLHNWIGRRWNLFVISINCSVALISSHIIGNYLGVAFNWSWLLTSVVLSIILWINGLKARKQAMKMIEFLSSCPIEKKRVDTKK